MIQIPKTTEDAHWKSHLEQTYGWTIEDPWYTEVPSIAQKYKGEDSTWIEIVETDIAQHLLRTYLFKDNFESHKARRAFREILEQGQETLLTKWIREHNKLSRNRMAVVYQAASILVNMVSEQVSDLSLNVSAADFEKYDPLTLEEKTTFVRSFEHKLYTLLERLAH